jgi:hypothetical protein
VPFHGRPCFAEIAFYDCEEGRETGGGGGASLHNAAEAELACLLFKGAGGVVGVSITTGHGDSGTK